MEIAAIVISLVAAATAVYAAIHSKRSADAASEAVAIERERRADEKRDRELSAVPELSAGEHEGAVWRIDGSSLMGVITNRGPGVATIHVVACTPGPFPVSDAEWDRNQAVLSQGGVLPIKFRWRAYPLEVDIELVVRYLTPTGAAYEAWFMLHPAGEDGDGRPMWRSAGSRRRPLG